MRLTSGESFTLTASVIPDDAGDRSVVWKSSDDIVATVNHNGVVTGRTNGSATITATTRDGGYSASCVVTVGNAGMSPESIFILASLGVLVLSGTGVGIYLWRRKR